MAVWLVAATPIIFCITRKRHPSDKGLADVLVQAVINTIEYVLSCISHTASYLRLWALSLAHSQLTEVFFEQIVGISLDINQSNQILTAVVGGISLLLTYTIWFGANIAVICLMEALSAFLHCLRLAWIEFNDKFFEADGWLFEPLGVDVQASIAVTARTARSE